MTTEKKTFRIALLEGDGIGPEISAEAVKVLDAIQARGTVSFEIERADFGGAAYFKHGTAFPEATKEACDRAGVRTALLVPRLDLRQPADAPTDPIAFLLNELAR